MTRRIGMLTIDVQTSNVPSMTERRRPGAIRDAIFATFKDAKRELTIAEVRAGVSEALGQDVPSSSVRSYLNINTPGQFIRTARGRYRLVRR